MFTATDVLGSFAKTTWEDGKEFVAVEGPYRYKVIAVCSNSGRQRAVFANGEHSYFAFMKIVSPNGTWIKHGSGIVPVLKNGRIIMVVEQRPAQGWYQSPKIAKIGGKDVDLAQFGQHSSLEFPGGAVDPGEGLKAGFLRELEEETGVSSQSALCITRNIPSFAQGSDIALAQFFLVAYLQGLDYKEKVETDGGLHVFALSADEIQENIHRGVIVSAQAGISPWSFLKEIKHAELTGGLHDLVAKGYISIETLKISKPK